MRFPSCSSNRLERFPFGHVSAAGAEAALVRLESETESPVVTGSMPPDANSLTGVNGPGYNYNYYAEQSRLYNPDG
jgi:hypothetical protein